MPRKNPRPAAKKRREKREQKLRLATENGKLRPSYFRSQNEHMSHTGLALAFALANSLGKPNR